MVQVWLWAAVSLYEHRLPRSRRFAAGADAGADVDWLQLAPLLPPSPDSWQHALALLCMELDVLMNSPR